MKRNLLQASVSCSRLPNKREYLFFFIWSLIFSLSSCSNGETEHTKIKLTEKPVKISSVKNISGFFGDRMKVNRDQYLKNFPIDKYVDFIVKREHTEWNWTKAEQHGKWLESAYLSAIQAEDQQLLAKAQTILDRIIDSQEESGYVGATSKSFRTPERPVRGMDPYELYFVFHAFITVYEETGNEKALVAVEKLADYFLEYFGPDKLGFWPSDLRYPQNKHKKLAGTSQSAGHSVHYSWEGTLLADPVARLYELTGKEKYLDWSKWVVSNIDKWSGWDSFSRLDSVADGKLGVGELQPYVHSHAFHMNFMGFLRLYLITGDTTLLRKVKGAWDDIRERQMYITGGVSVAEHYELGYVKPLSGNIVETCATMSWMQLTQMLLEITGDVKYADAIERLMINHVFAAQDIDEGLCRYHTAPNGTKPAGFFHGPDCCTASGHRIISLIPTFAYAENGSAFFINQYLESEYEGKDLQFTIETKYPESENIKLTITTEKPVKKDLLLRIPSWCKHPIVKVKGKEINDIKPGSYLTLSNKWMKHDVIDITFPMEEKWIKRENHSEYSMYYLPGGEHMYKETATDRIPSAFTRGPLVYAVDMVWNPQLEEDNINLENDLRINTSEHPTMESKPDNKMLGPVYEAKATYKGKDVKVNLTPFANIGQWYRKDGPKPDKHSKAYSYGIWLYDTSFNK
ncbi:beta-L-arabinofuranosidase domain-containing protein [Carboxylicivirga linearis]|uniref:Glycoside hydrolase family 127 protein n=1 Tax=Carboxylicivirga linearis TaxID=1628157 RepID=A0ABS5JXD9_9BACT|nr:beta-L-arabinofuranosidase domain-containing protein [Carboxylicivirga linearis]MBS2099582.1 glycoside hydrolase family 127 protein [Carboxylicivirga linearis]